MANPEMKNYMDPKPMNDPDEGHGFATAGDLRFLISRVGKLEEQVEVSSDRHDELASAELVAHIQNQLCHNKLEKHLKATIRAVERLAKGKSLGTLGLPSEEEWNPPA